MNNNVQNEKGLTLGVSIITVLAILMIASLSFDYEPGQFKKGHSAIMGGICFQFWGVLFLLSYYFSHKTFFLRGLIWICRNFSSPRDSRMAFFYFVLFFGLGTMILLYGIGLFYSDEGQRKPHPLPPNIEPIENWWYKDPVLYLIFVALIAGIYYIHKTSKNK
jgi:hypothetical protein